MQVEGRRKTGYSQVNNSIILRISYVYVTYILRIWYVIDKGKTGEGCRVWKEKKKKRDSLESLLLVSRDGEIRTHDLLLPKQAF